MLLAVTLRAATYTVGTIPNVHLSDTAAYVSDPDGILNLSDRQAINALMRSVRRTTTAEPAVVIVGDIEGGDIDGFATDLFEAWGLGKSDLDNGLLILVAKDLRRAAIRPGYGLEGVLPDIVCANILKYKMFPSFREGDYGAGLIAACQAVETILTDPVAAEEIRSSMADADFNGEDDLDPFQVYLVIVIVVTIVMIIVLLIKINNVRALSRHDKYVSLATLKPVYLPMTMMGIGIPLVASLPLLLILYKLRNAPHKCPQCYMSMTKVDEVHDNDYLRSNQDLEERIGSVDYDVWLCPNCGETDIEQYVNTASGYKECEQCHTYAARLLRRRILRQPTATTQGRGVNEYSCIHCGHITAIPFAIPVVVAAPIYRGGGFGGGGGFSGGGFGGGHTGGGGASGGW